MLFSNTKDQAPLTLPSGPHGTALSRTSEDMLATPEENANKSFFHTTGPEIEVQYLSSGQMTPKAAQSQALNTQHHPSEPSQVQELSSRLASLNVGKEANECHQSTLSQASSPMTASNFIESVPYPDDATVNALRRALFQNHAKSSSDLQSLSITHNVNNAARNANAATDVRGRPRYDELDPSSLLANEGAPRRENHTYTAWATNLPWRYLSPEENIETISFPTHVRAFSRPPTMRPLANEVNPRLESFGGRYSCPAIVMDADSDSDITAAVFDENLKLFKIWPPKDAAMDLRSMETHPDCVPHRKLCEYQAVEIMDYDVWRGDRHTNSCTLPSCGAPLVDHDTTTVLCLGCGPQSHMRYCSREHQLKDLADHLAECGEPQTWIDVRYHVDPETYPPRFQRSMPMIKDINSPENYKKARQRLHAIWNRGAYTLFRGKDEMFAFPVKFWSPANDLCSPLSAPSPLPPTKPAVIARTAANLNPRVERLLNIALLDEKNLTLVRYLYQLVRLGLRQQLGKQLAALAENTLGRQILEEFGFNAAACGRSWAGVKDTPPGLLPLLPIPEADPCECTWNGDWGPEPPARSCTEECRARFRRVEAVSGVLFRGSGIRGHVQRLEAQEWLLRVWHRQHRTVGNWRHRLFGVGFPGTPMGEFVGKVPVRGVGWDGHACRGMFGGWFEKLS